MERNLAPGLFLLVLSLLAGCQRTSPLAITTAMVPQLRRTQALTGASSPETFGPIGEPKLLYQTNFTGQLTSTAAFNPIDNQYLIAWATCETSDWNFLLYAARLDTSGATSEKKVILTSENYDVHRPSLACNSITGENLIVWEAGGYPQLLGARLAQDGTFIGNSFDIPFDVSGYNYSKRRPDVGYNPTANDFLVIADDGWSSLGLVCQNVAANGSMLGSGFDPVEGNEFNGEDYQKLVFNSTRGEYLILHGLGAIGAQTYYAQRTKGDGEGIGASAPVEGSHPSAAFNPDTGEYLLVGATGGSLALQRIKSNLTTEWEVGQRSVIEAGGKPEVPAVSYNPSLNEFLVVWEDRANANTAIYGQRVSAAGVPVGSRMAIAQSGNNTLEDLTSNTTQGEYLVSWLNSLDGQDDLYAQRLGLDEGSVPSMWPLESSITVDHAGLRCLTLDWSPAIGAEAGYRLYQGGKLIASLATTSGSYTVSGLRPNTAYTFKIEAGNQAGIWSTDGPSIEARTLSICQLTQALIERINQLVTSGEIKEPRIKELIAPLRAILKKQDQKNSKAALNHLQKFISLVKPQKKHSLLSSDLAQSFLEDANALMNELQ
ncbi:MAG TPA: hypothetical protein DD435_09010 [Cyanobacteria bacterium UBA8530]|nr:hypothetical protein [Cyanobacteria bacterium UBA8530]